MPNSVLVPTQLDCNITFIPNPPATGTVSKLSEEIILIPINICITTLRPDIIVLDKKTKSFNIFELTCPLEPNIGKRHSEKRNKYFHFLTDITSLKPTVTCFEIGSRGYESPDNQARLKTLHSYCKAGVKITKFKENISALATTGKSLSGIIQDI